MGGVPCWKEIIDQRNALVHQLDCMAESIRIAGSTTGKYPTYEQRDTFIKKANDLALTAAEIQKYVSG